MRRATLPHENGIDWRRGYETAPYIEERCQTTVGKYSDEARIQGVGSVSSEVLAAGGATNGGVSAPCVHLHTAYKRHRNETVRLLKTRTLE